MLPRPNGHSDLHLLTQATEDRQQSVDGEAIELDVADAGEVGSGDAGELSGLVGGEAAGVQCLDDLRGEDGPELLKLGVRVAEIAEDVTASSDKLHAIITV